jgi:hypothetical protein
MGEVVNLQEIAQVWRRSRRIYAVFVALNQQFKLGAEPCKELDCPIDRADTEVLGRVRAWIEDLDSRCDAAQLRQLFQSRPLASEENLRTLIRFYVEKEQHLQADRDKTDFLLVHYFSFCAPVALQEGSPTLEDFAEIVEPVLGECSTVYPGWLEGLALLCEKLAECETLQDLVELEIIDKARELKREAGDKYFGTSALLAFAHYNFLARRTFFRLLHSDLIFIRGALIELQQRNVKEIDGLAAGMSEHEPLEHLHKLVREWKRVFEGDYSRGYNFLSIAGLRLALMAALEKATVEQVIEPEPMVIAAEPVAEPEPSQPEALVEEIIEVEPEPPKFSIESTVEDVKADLEASKSALAGKNLPVAKVRLDGHEVVLASWEVGAYLNPSAPGAVSLQRAVAARALLIVGMAERDRSSLLQEAIALAQVEGAQLQEMVAQARERKDIDSAVNLAASGKRLSALAEQAMRTGNEVKA